MTIRSGAYRSAFTLVELVFTVMILGIVASIGASIIAKVYDGYILQRAQHRASIKTELAANQIAARLRYAIPGTIRRINSTGGYERITDPLVGSPDSYVGLQWVGYDADGFEAINGKGKNGKGAASQYRRPGWTGLCDIDVSDKDTVVTPGSKLEFEDTIIKNLSGKDKGISDAVVFFPADDGTVNEYLVKGYVGDTNLSLTPTPGAPRTLSDHYKLAWSSYALVIEEKDLYLYYRFDPLQNISYKKGKKSLLLKNITTFRYKGAGSALRIKICRQERLGADSNITSCKEKVVF